MNLDYFRCISAADDCLGRLLDALDELGFAQNTVVIYTSDNGYYLGEHGLGDKRSAYDESLRVPLLVRDPSLGAKARGRVVNEMVLNLDLAQTLLDFAGVPAPRTMQGRSWRPLLTGDRVRWRQSWFYEYFAENQKNSRVPDITAVRTADAKLIKIPRPRRLDRVVRSQERSLRNAQSLQGSELRGIASEDGSRARPAGE